MCSELLQGGCNCRWLVPFLLRDADANIGEVNYSYMKVPGKFVGESTILKPKRLSKSEMTTHSRTRMSQTESRKCQTKRQTRLDISFVATGLNGLTMVHCVGIATPPRFHCKPISSAWAGHPLNWLMEVLPGHSGGITPRCVQL